MEVTARNKKADAENCSEMVICQAPLHNSIYSILRYYSKQPKVVYTSTYKQNHEDKTLGNRKK